MMDGELCKDELTAAVAVASCMTELLTRLDVPATPLSRRRMSDRIARDGIDHSHWRHSPRTVYSTDELARAVAASTSFAGVLRLLQRPQAGGTQSYLAGRIRREGLDTSHFTGRAHNRGTTRSRLSADEILVVLPTGSNRRRTPQLRRALRDKGVPDRCDECDLAPTWQGRPLTLVVEHRSGDWLDNRLADMEVGLVKGRQDRHSAEAWPACAEHSFRAPR